jgi:hypothetical protein
MLSLTAYPSQPHAGITQHVQLHINTYVYLDLSLYIRMLLLDSVNLLCHKFTIRTCNWVPKTLLLSCSNSSNIDRHRLTGLTSWWFGHCLQAVLPCDGPTVGSSSAQWKLRGCGLRQEGDTTQGPCGCSLATLNSCTLGGTASLGS